MLLSEQVKQGKAQASAEAHLELVKDEGKPLFKSGLKALGKTNLDLDLETSQKSVRWKLALASWIKEQTPIKTNYQFPNEFRR